MPQPEFYHKIQKTIAKYDSPLVDEMGTAQYRTIVTQYRLTSVGDDIVESKTLQIDPQYGKDKEDLILQFNRELQTATPEKAADLNGMITQLEAE